MATDKRRCIGKKKSRNEKDIPGAFYKRSCASVTAWRLRTAGSVAASGISAYFRPTVNQFACDWQTPAPTRRLACYGFFQGIDQ